MKTLVNLIQEAMKDFRLDVNEREALATFLGIFLGELGEEKDQDMYKAIILNGEEVSQLKGLYDCLSDKQTYKVINRSVIKDDIELLKKIYKSLDEKDLLGNDWDLIDAFEKIAGI